MSLRPVDWQLSMWNLEQRSQEGPKDPSSLAAVAGRQVEVERRRQEDRNKAKELSRAAAQRPIEVTEERQSRGGRGGGRPRGGSGAYQEATEDGASDATSFEAYG